MNHKAAPPPTTHWANIKESTSSFGIAVLLAVYRVLGKRGFRVFLIPVLLWYCLTRPVARAASYQYLNKIAAMKNMPPPTLKNVLAHFVAFGESILDKFLLMSNRFEESRVTIERLPPLYQLIEQKKGALILCAHLGNWEICKTFSKTVPHLKITILIHDKHAQRFSRLMAKASPDNPFELLQVTEITPNTAILLKEKLDRGEMIVIAGDRVPVASSARTAMASFLGESAPFPVGAYALASLLQAPIYLMFVVQTEANINIVFEHFSEPFRLPRRERETILSQLAQRYAARLEHYCLATPLQWFNFYNFWHEPYPQN